MKLKMLIDQRDHFSLCLFYRNLKIEHSIFTLKAYFFKFSLLSFVLFFQFFYSVDSSKNHQTQNKIDSSVIYTSSDAVLYNTENISTYTNTNKADAKVNKQSNRIKTKPISHKNKSQLAVKLPQPKIYKKSFKELPNPKYFSISALSTYAIVNTYKYAIKLYENIRVELAHHFNNKNVLCFHKNIILFNAYTSFITVRPPPAIKFKQAFRLYFI